MKHLMKFFLLAFVVAMFAACTADYDTFSKSRYKTFNGISFDEQDGEPSVYPDEHLIKVTLVAPPESLSTWESVTLASYDISSLATIHLVDGKFKEFPKDSAALDSLANEVSYVEGKLHKGDKIRIPKSLTVYIMVVAENGDPSIWEMDFTIPGVEIASSSSAADEGDDAGDEGSDVSSSSESSSSSAAEEKVESSSSVVLSDNNDFSISFKNELENTTSGDTVYVTFAQGTDLATVELDLFEIHRSAKIDAEPSKVSDWSKEQTFVVSAEDGSERIWVVVVQAIKSSAADLQIWFKNQLKVNRGADTIAVKLQSGETIAAAAVDSFKVSVGASVSPDPKDVKWSETQQFKVTAEDGTEKTWVVSLDVAAADEKASDEKELISISAKDEIKAATIDAEKKTVVLHLADQRSLASVSLTVKISESASQNLQSGALDLRTPVTMTITAEDASTVVWTISADYPLSSEANIMTFALDGITAEVAPTIDVSKHEIAFEVAYGTDLSDVYFTATYSDYAKGPAAADCHLDLTSGNNKIKVTAQDGTEVEWTVVVTVGEAPVVLEAPRIRSMKIDGKDAVVDSVKENGKWIHWIHYDNLEFRSDLSKLKISDIKLSDGAEITGVTDGSSYDLGTGVKATVSNGSESVSYLIHAGYQLPGSDFNTWKSSDVMSPDSIWGNANMVGETTSKFTSGSMIGVQIKTSSILGKIASGSLYTAEFNPKGVGTLAMASSSTWPDGNELLDFGKKFNARPSYLEVKFSYAGSGDSCDIYLVLENRTGDMNRNRSASDVNKLVASAWYRSTTADNTGRKNPDVVSVSETDASGMRTLLLKLQYGTPLAGSPIENSSVFNTKLSSKDSKAIDNSVIQGTGDEPVTHIRLVFASSADGNHYNGKSGATLKVDAIRLVY